MCALPVGSLSDDIAVIVHVAAYGAYFQTSFNFVYFITTTQTVMNFNPNLLSREEANATLPQYESRKIYGKVKGPYHVSPRPGYQ